MFDIKSVPKVKIREGSIGKAEIKKDKETYTLFVDNLQWMKVITSSLREIKEFYSSYDLATGSILLSGFGFGILPQWLASKDSVTDVTVVEYSKDVIDLFLRHNTLDPKINIKISDIREYRDNYHYDWAIFDHYELDRVPTKEDLSLLENNLIYEKVWFWSLESKLESYYSWQDFKNDYSQKLPDLDNNKLKEYLELVRCMVNLQD